MRSTRPHSTLTFKGAFPPLGETTPLPSSEAFFSATRSTRSAFELFNRPKKELEPPRLALNILNGGWHAYTNPVLSDFSEFMLVAKSRNIAEVVPEHNAIQRIVKEKQLGQPKIVVSGNPVNGFRDRATTANPSISSSRSSTAWAFPESTS